LFCLFLFCSSCFVSVLLSFLFLFRCCSHSCSCFILSRSWSCLGALVLVLFLFFLVLGLV
jgi:hypothetical protein